MTIIRPSFYAYLTQGATQYEDLDIKLSFGASQPMTLTARMKGQHSLTNPAGVGTYSAAYAITLTINFGGTTWTSPPFWPLKCPKKVRFDDYHNTATIKGETTLTAIDVNSFRLSRESLTLATQTLTTSIAIINAVLGAGDVATYTTNLEPNMAVYEYDVQGQRPVDVILDLLKLSGMDYKITKDAGANLGKLKFYWPNDAGEGSLSTLGMKYEEAEEEEDGINFFDHVQFKKPSKFQTSWKYSGNQSGIQTMTFSPALIGTSIRIGATSGNIRNIAFFDAAGTSVVASFTPYDADVFYVGYPHSAGPAASCQFDCSLDPSTTYSPYSALKYEMEIFGFPVGTPAGYDFHFDYYHPGDPTPPAAPPTTQRWYKDTIESPIWPTKAYLAGVAGDILWQLNKGAYSLKLSLPYIEWNADIGKSFVLAGYTGTFIIETIDYSVTPSECSTAITAVKQ